MGGARRKRLRPGVLSHLEPEQARETLHRLLAPHPDLGVEAEIIARSVLGEVTFESIASQVQDTLGARSIEDLNSRAGPDAHGYVEPEEAAWEILNETLEPFLADIERRVCLGLEDDALALCQGVLLGLYRLEREGEGELAKWAPDFIGEAAGQAARPPRIPPALRAPLRAGVGVDARPDHVKREVRSVGWEVG